VFIVVILTLERSEGEGSLYLSFVCFPAAGGHLQPALRLLHKRPSSPKINPEFVSYFLASKNERQSIHVYHTLHHMLTTISPSRKRHFPKTPFKNASKQAKNTATTSQNFSDRNAAKNHLKLPANRTPSSADRHLERTATPDESIYTCRRNES
jgi:hypothetical protein